MKNELPTEVSAQWVQGKRVNDPFGFSWGNRDFELRRVEQGTPKIIPERGTLYLENGECGWIGTDKTYHLKRDLRLSDGSPYPGEEEEPRGERGQQEGGGHDGDPGLHLEHRPEDEQVTNRKTVLCHVTSN